jgi:hypothetical protein
MKENHSKELYITKIKTDKEVMRDRNAEMLER